MKNYPLLSISLISMAVLMACGTVPPESSTLDLARSDYTTAVNNRQTSEMAAGELRDASLALQKANEAAARGGPASTVDHLAYLARQRVAIANEVGKQKSAELTVTNANSVRDRVQLAARANEADAAQKSVTTAQRDSEESRRQAELAQRMAREAAMRNSALEAQIRDLNAKQTARGLVITIDDVLFDTNKSQLKPGASRSFEKLVSFMNQYPQRTVLVEGYTDNTGRESANLSLSERRSDAVRRTLIMMGINSNRITSRGYGEAYAVADNDSSGGRQLNRRVELILSDEKGNIAPR